MKTTQHNQKLVARFRRINIAVFILALAIVVTVMHVAFILIIRAITHADAARYAVSSSEAFSAHLRREISLVSNAARSPAVIDWLRDEHDEEKKALAIASLTETVSEYYSYNLYVVFADSLHEYAIGHEYELMDFAPIDTLDRAYPEDAWYFTAMEAEDNIVLSVNRDYILDRQRLWLDYRIVVDGEALGVICTGLDFAHLAEELFSHYEARHLTGYVITSEGYVNLDSTMNSEGNYTQDEQAAYISEVFDPDFVTAINAYSAEEHDGAPSYVRSSSSRRYMTITPLRGTDWLFAIVYDPASMMDSSRFLPVIFAILACMAAFALTINTVSNRLLLGPLQRLDDSLQALIETGKAEIYGRERDDELGDLSSTIWDLFVKANYDALTGIRNRRFMENALEHIISFGGRADSSHLSVIMMDVDNFKKYNDAYGHDEGDKCLKAVAGALNAAVTRDGDFAARYGGEEFILVLPNTDEAGACLIAEKALENVRQLNLPHSGNTAAPYVTISAGVASAPITHGTPWQDYVKQADAALYQAKEGGRDRFVVAK